MQQNEGNQFSRLAAPHRPHIIITCYRHGASSKALTTAQKSMDTVEGYQLLSRLVAATLLLAIPATELLQFVVLSY